MVEIGAAMTAADWPYPAPVDDGAADHLTVGLAVPDIELPSTDGGAVSLARLDKRAVVFIYPWTGRPGLPNPPGWDEIPGAHGSTPQALGFQDLLPEFVRLCVSVFGVSGQTHEDQRAFAARAGLTFPLLSDADGRLRDALNLPTFETGGVRYLSRLTLVTDAGKIARVFYPVHPPDRHAADVLRALAG
jgi:peroxiredoxin